MMGRVQKMKKEMRLPGGGPNRRRPVRPSPRPARPGRGRGRMGRAMGGGENKRSMYMEGGKAHSGAQPVYGNTVETSMPKAGAN